LVISNHNIFRVLFDTVASVYFVGKMYLYFSIGNGQHTHIHTRLTALYPGLPGWAGTRKVKPICILLKQETVSGQWHQLGHMQVCTSLQTDSRTSPVPLSFLQAGCPSCRPTNSVKALKATQGVSIVPIVSAHLHSLCVRLFVQLLSVCPSTNLGTGIQWVCCWDPCRQEISMDSKRQHSAAYFYSTYSLFLPRDAMHPRY